MFHFIYPCGLWFTAERFSYVCPFVYLFLLSQLHLHAQANFLSLEVSLNIHFIYTSSYIIFYPFLTCSCSTIFSSIPCLFMEPLFSLSPGIYFLCTLVYVFSQCLSLYNSFWHNAWCASLVKVFLSFSLPQQTNIAFFYFQNCCKEKKRQFMKRKQGKWEKAKKHLLNSKQVPKRRWWCRGILLLFFPNVDAWKREKKKSRV